MDIGGYMNSKTGQYYDNVLRGASLTNDPVFKGQKCLELSENIEPTGKKDINIKMEEKIMDKVKEFLNSLITAIQEALKGPDADAVKGDIPAMIEAINQAAGIEAAKKEPEKEQEEPKMTDVKKEKVEMTEEKKQEIIQFAEEVKNLRVKMAELEKNNGNLNLKLAEKEFDQKYLNKKILPARKAEWFGLYMSNRELAEKIIADLPELNLSETIGSGKDINFKEIKSVQQARDILSDKALEIQSKDSKLSFSDAMSKAQVENPGLMELIKKDGR
jgi:hypothetical protein